MQEGLKSYGLALFTRVLGKSTEEATQIIDSASAEFKQSVHAYNGQYVFQALHRVRARVLIVCIRWFVEGRKPVAAEAH